MLGLLGINIWMLIYIVFPLGKIRGLGELRRQEVVACIFAESITFGETGCSISWWHLRQSCGAQQSRGCVQYSCFGGVELG